MRYGIQISGLQEGLRYLGEVQAAVGMATRARIGVAVYVPYGFWIAYGYYASGRAGRLRTQPGGYRFDEKAAQAIAPEIGPALAEAILAGPIAVSSTAAGLSERLAQLMREFQPQVSGRLRRETRPFRGGGIENLGRMSRRGL